MFTVSTRVRGRNNTLAWHPHSYYASLAWKAPRPWYLPIQLLSPSVGGPFNL